MVFYSGVSRISVLKLLEYRKKERLLVGANRFDFYKYFSGIKNFNTPMYLHDRSNIV